MSIPELRSTETPIFDDMVIEQMQNHLDDEPGCALPGCMATATGRLVLICDCRSSILGCAPHLQTAVERMRLYALLDQKRKCPKCGQVAAGVEVVPL